MPQDKGLYMPVTIPRLDDKFINHLDEYTLPEIAFHVANHLLGDSIPADDLKTIIYDAINFYAPIVELEKDVYVLELFHGPSLAFKDFGARFMSRIMSYFLEEGEKKLDVLVATSGDTGGAVALGFLGVPNTRVTILYPKGKVSDIQELQLTTNGQNIRALEINGTFDDCQALVKQAFTDKDLNEKFRLLAWKMGLPVEQFIAATNANDTVPAFLKSGIYQPKPSVATLSNAMDVGNPSNWVRIADMFKANMDELKNIITGFSYDDEETLTAIKAVDKDYNYVVCPHTAVAWKALKDWKKLHADSEASGIFLATAHPCKFPDVFPDNIAEKIDVPEQVKALEAKEKQSVILSKEFAEFKDYLLKNG